jgi:hypothetical protein
LELQIEHKDHDLKVNALCFSKTMERIASSALDRKIIIRNPNGGDNLLMNLANS